MPPFFLTFHYAPLFPLLSLCPLFLALSLCPPYSCPFTVPPFFLSFHYAPLYSFSFANLPCYSVNQMISSYISTLLSVDTSKMYFKVFHFVLPFCYRGGGGHGERDPFLVHLVVVQSMLFIEEMMKRLPVNNAVRDRRAVIARSLIHADCRRRAQTSPQFSVSHTSSMKRVGSDDVTRPHSALAP